MIHKHIIIKYTLIIIIIFFLLSDYFIPIASLPHRSYIIFIISIFSCLFISYLGRVRWKISNTEKTIIIIYFLYWEYAFLLCWLSEDVTLAFRGTLSYFINRMAMFPVLLLFLHTVYNSAIRKIPIYLGFIFSIQAILLILLILLNIDLGVSEIQFKNFYKETDYIMRPYAYGLLGFGGDTARIQSYFSEANKFAQFLIYPLFLSLAYYMVTTKKRYLIVFFLFYLSIYLTYSVAVNLSIILTFVIFYLLKRKNIGTIVLLYFVILLLCIIFILYSPFFEYLVYNPFNLNLPFLGKEVSYLERLSELSYTWEIFMEKPWGIGFILHEDSSLIVDKRFSNAFLEEMVRMGIFGIILRSLLILLVIFSLRNLIIKKENKIRIYIGLSFICITLASLVYGPFDQSNTLFGLAGFISFEESYNLRFTPKIRQPVKISLSEGSI